MNPDRLPCDLIQDLLPLYHDGVTSEPTAQAVEEHLEACPACQAEYESIVLPPPAAPATPEEEDPKVLFRKTVRAWRRRNQGAILMALFVIGVLIWLGNLFLHNTDVVPVSMDEVKQTLVFPYEGEDGRERIFFYCVNPLYSGTSGSISLTETKDGWVANYRLSHAILTEDYTYLRGPEIYCNILDLFPADAEDPHLAEFRLNGETIWTASDPAPEHLPDYVRAYAEWEQAGQYEAVAAPSISSWISYYSSDLSYLGIEYPNGQVTLWNLDGSLLYNDIPGPELDLLRRANYAYH